MSVRNQQGYEAERGLTEGYMSVPLQHPGPAPNPKQAQRNPCRPANDERPQTYPRSNRVPTPHCTERTLGVNSREPHDRRHHYRQYHRHEHLKPHIEHLRRRAQGTPIEARNGILLTRAPAPEHSTQQHQAASTLPPPRATGAAERQPGGSRESGAHDECAG
ncbi:hypothetical protein V499_04183 [Pseudogymnoascus sp. VKM F-103]|nr:hypothetical protein V499_04183 [Pseudogymnoascus sp. VKM F-103]